MRLPPSCRLGLVEIRAARRPAQRRSGSRARGGGVALAEGSPGWCRNRCSRRTRRGLDHGRARAAPRFLDPSLERHRPLDRRCGRLGATLLATGQPCVVAVGVNLAARPGARHRRRANLPGVEPIATSSLPSDSVRAALYLNSESPRRQALLGQLGVAFVPISAAIDETWNGFETPAYYVERLALEKAQAGWRSIIAQRDPLPVLGADTAVVLEGTILGKPSDPSDAVNMLAALSGRHHDVYTAVALVEPSSASHRSRVNVTRVTLRGLQRGSARPMSPPASPSARPEPMRFRDWRRPSSKVSKAAIPG